MSSSPTKRLLAGTGLEIRALVVYPTSLKQADGTYSWFAASSNGQPTPDLALFDTLVRELGQRYCIDLSRVYLLGHSLGASFANTVACARAGQVRAVASLGGGIWVRSCSAPVAAMVIHNPKDRLVSVENAYRALDVFLDANGLQGTSYAELAGDPLNCRRYGPPGTNNPVYWCPHRKDHKSNGKYYPHNWPDVTAREIEAFLNSLP